MARSKLWYDSVNSPAATPTVTTFPAWYVDTNRDTPSRLNSGGNECVYSWRISRVAGAAVGSAGVVPAAALAHGDSSSSNADMGDSLVSRRRMSSVRQFGATSTAQCPI